MRLLRTASFRLATSFVGLSLTSIVLLLTLAYALVTGWIREGLEAKAEAELARLVALAAASGMDGLRADLAQHPNVEGAPMIFRLSGPGGGVEVGPELRLEDDTAEPSDAADDDGVDVLLWPPWSDEDEPFIARQAAVDGGTLVVGVDARRLQETGDFFTEQLPLGLALVLPLSLPGAIMVARLALRRIEHITDAASRIQRGQLTERVAVRGSDDEYDRLAQSINAMLDSIHDLTQGLRQVSDDIAHDLRSPLTRLRAQLVEVRDRQPATAAQDGGIEAAIAQTDVILETFGALLRIAQIEAGTRRQGFATVGLAPLLRDLVETFDPVAAAAGQHLTLHIAAEPLVLADRHLLTQLLANLIENALTHSPAGARVEVSLAVDAGTPAIMVADDGPGIPPHERAKVFTRFYRLDRSRGTAGAGLGLSLVAAIARLHRIDVAFDDAAVGTRVVLRWPAAG